MSALAALRVAHIAAGGLALAVFWIPLVARKGKVVHRRVGWVYAGAMLVVAATAWAICALRLMDGDEGNDARAIFLAFVALLAANAAATGIRIVRTKARTSRHEGAFDYGSSALLLVGSAAIGGLGWARSSPLDLAFAGLGTFRAVSQIRFWLRATESRLAWFYEHMANMLTSCIATVTAFLVVNVGRVGGDRWSLAVWLAPGIVGGIGIAVWQRRYRRKFQTS